MERSKVCLVLLESTLAANLNQAEKYRSLIDLVELRADYLAPEEYQHLAGFPARIGLPIILTFRRTADSGRFAGSGTERSQLIRQALAGRFSFVDLEEDFHIAELEQAAKAAGTRIIRSCHNFEGIPAALEQKFESLGQQAGELPKLAVMPRSTADLVKLLTLAKTTRTREKILIGMGDFGFATRILAAKLGSYLSYCSIPNQSAAPGHIDPQQLETVYGFRQITGSTLVYGIIGNPVMHTASPQIHNRGYRLLGLDAVYVPFPVDDLQAFPQVVELLDIKGFSVTIPHKEGIIPLLDYKEPGLELIGACNTVERIASVLHGSNTDTTGFITPLKQLLGRNLQGLKATVIGAGGSARSIVWTLRKEGVEVLIINRTVSRAAELAAAFGCRAATLGQQGLDLMAGYSDLIVQSTSVGLAPHIEADPLPDYAFCGHEVVYDIIYKPPVTRFLQRAQNAGCRTIEGMQMLLQQAYAQFVRFTGQDYPVEE